MDHSRFPRGLKPVSIEEMNERAEARPLQSMETLSLETLGLEILSEQGQRRAGRERAGTAESDGLSENWKVNAATSGQTDETLHE